MARYYMAYGSNLNLRQMAHRCPSAKVFGTGMLQGYQLIFCRVATIVPQGNSEVPVAIWEIDDKCEKALDVYEGYPRLYRKENLTVNIRGRDIEAMVYIMNEDRASMPSKMYFNTIAEGYSNVGFDTVHLIKALDETEIRMK